MKKVNILENKFKLFFFYNKNGFLKKKIISKKIFIYLFFIFLKYFNQKYFLLFLFFKFKFLYLSYFRLNYKIKFMNNLYFNLFKKFFKTIQINEPYAFLYSSKEAKSSLIDLTFDSEGYSICLNEEDLVLWYRGKKDLFLINFYFFIKNNFFFFLEKQYFEINYKNKNIEYDFLKYFFKKEEEWKWLNKIFIFKRYIRLSSLIKNKFFKEFSRFFWKNKLKYWFEYYIIVKNKVDFFCVFFYYFKLDCILFFYLFESVIFSKFFLLVDYYRVRLKYFGYIYNRFLRYFFHYFFFDYFFFDFYWCLIKLRIIYYCLFRHIAALKAINSIYGPFQHVEKLDIYFYNLMTNTTCIDVWLEENNLSGEKISLLFLKGLFLLDENFNIKRRPWHSFFKRFYDILMYIRIYKKKNKVFSQLYKILYKVLYFIKKNRFNLRKKSVKLKPLRMGVQVHL